MFKVQFKVQLNEYGRVAHLNWQHASKRNALTPAGVRLLQQQLDQLATRSDIRVLVLSGQDGQFCSGYDLSCLQDASSHDAPELAHLLETIYHFPRPTIAAIEGVALGGGAGLASVCDTVIMAEDAQVGYPEVHRGFVAAIVGVFLLRIVGVRRAKQLLFSGQLLHASTALQLQLATELAASGQAVTQALQLAQQWAAHPPQAMRYSKLLLAEVAELDISTGLEYAVQLNRHVRNTPECQEGIAAFIEKRPPVWPTASDTD